jgi:hypothetical protein
MTEMMVRIMVKALDILGTTTMEMKQNRASEVILHLRLLEAHVVLSEKFLKRVAGITKLEDGFKKLDKMTNEEARMAYAEVLRIAHNIDKKVEGVDEKVQCVGIQVKDVDKKVEVIEEKVQIVIDGAQRTACDLNDGKSSSSVPSSSTVKYLTRSQGGNYEKTLENGNLLPIRLQVTISHANVNTKEQQSGSIKAASLRNGRCPVPCFGSTGNVRSSYP